MVRDEIQIDETDLIVWAHQREFLIPGQVTHDDRSELAEADERTHRTLVFGVAVSAQNIFTVEGEAFACRVWLACFG